MMSLFYLIILLLLAYGVVLYFQADTQQRMNLIPAALIPLAIQLVILSLISMSGVYGEHTTMAMFLVGFISLPIAFAINTIWGLKRKQASQKQLIGWGSGIALSLTATVFIVLFIVF